MTNITLLWIWAAKNTINEFKTNKYPTFNKELHDRFKELMEAWHQSKLNEEEAYVSHSQAIDTYEELIIEYAKILKKEASEAAAEEEETDPIPF